MTYMNVWQAAISDVGVFVQTLKLSSLKGLEWASEAIHQYQALTGAARCTCFIDLDAQSEDGVYDVGQDIDIIEKINYFGTNVTLTQGAIPVNLVDYDYLFKNEEGYMLPGSQGYATLTQPLLPPIGFNIPSQVGNSSLFAFSQFYASQFGKCNLLFWPFQGVSGRLRIYYKPYLLPYTPDTVGRWNRFGDPPDTTMATEHIPREFNAGYEGIKSYVKAQIYASIPNAERLFPGKYQEMMGKFEAGIQLVLKTNPALGVNNKTQPRLIRRVM